MTFCAFANIPYKILNGNTEGNSKFLGLVPLTDTLTTLSSSLGKFTNTSSNISAINNLSLGTKGQSLIDQITTIKTSVTGVTTLDASAVNASSQPSLFAQIEKTDINTISTEFTGVGNLSI